MAKSDLNPYTGYASEELCILLRRSRQALAKAGILKRLKKTYPFGRKSPLYDPEEVEALKKNLIRQDGLIALGRLKVNTPLREAFHEYPDDRDRVCPSCGGLAIGDPQPVEEERPALKPVGRRPHVIWCPACGFIEMKPGGQGEEQPNNTLEDTGILRNTA